MLQVMGKMGGRAGENRSLPVDDAAVVVDADVRKAAGSAMRRQRQSVGGSPHAHMHTRKL